MPVVGKNKVYVLVFHYQDSLLRDTKHPNSNRKLIILRYVAWPHSGLKATRIGCQCHQQIDKRNIYS
jgi:hypothetical protein